MGLKQEIEVVLFWRNTPVDNRSLAELLKVTPAEIKREMMHLIREYELREGGLQINCTAQGYVLEPKDEYQFVLQKIAPLEIRHGTMRTLALIALKEPIMQKQVIELRGTGAYDHIKELVEGGWISKEASNLTFVLKTTAQFKKNFKLKDESKLYTIESTAAFE